MAKASTATKIGDLRGKSDDELSARLTELRKEQFNLRIQKATGQLTNLARVGQVKREIAQVQTLQSEKRLGIKPRKGKAKKAA
ncbi:MAG TPA: 50S ribosomal protein L29 [Alphaproteobacteria bacterium]|nr:50S ribosomal protein L29 [Alphaproteobacteria bacterium]